MGMFDVGEHTDEAIEHIVRNMPFRDEIVSWLRTHPDVLEALKLLAVQRFVHFSGINTVDSVGERNDQVVGFVVYDIRKEELKQDFIVDEGSQHTNFVYYTNLPKDRVHLYGSIVKNINEFMKKYGTDGAFAGTHHPAIKSLHPELQQRINRYLKLTRRNLRSNS